LATVSATKTGKFSHHERNGIRFTGLGQNSSPRIVPGNETRGAKCSFPDKGGRGVPENPKARGGRQNKTGKDSIGPVPRKRTQNVKV